MLKVESLSFAYRQQPVLQDISFEIKKGDFCGIIGPNGAGKTTLLKILARILKPQKGNLLLENQDLNKFNIIEYAKKVAYLPSQISLSFSYTVDEFVMMGRFPYTGRYGDISDKDKKITERVMEEFEIIQYKKRKIWELSDGERQRVFISQVIAQETPLILFDEPTSHLDIGHSFKIMDILRKINNSGVTLIAVLHDLNLASEYCSHLFLLNKGKIFSEGTPEQVITYQNIEEVYETKVLVYKNPHTGKPYVFGIPADVLLK